MMRLTILAYHHVDARLAAQLRILRAYSHLTTVSDGVARLASDTGPGRLTALTFDDGYEEVYRHALPVLRAARVPATIYVPSRILENSQPFWWDQIGLIFRHSTAKIISWDGRQHACRSADAQRRLARSVQAALTLKPASQVALALANLEGQLKPEFYEIPREYHLIDRAKIAEIAASGVEIGSHTVNHECLTAVSETQADVEMRASKQALEEFLGLPIKGLAYPFGSKRHFNQALCRLAERAGYKYAVTTLPGTNCNGCSSFELKRYLVGMDDGPVVLIAMITGLWTAFQKLRNVKNSMLAAARGAASS